MANEAITEELFRSLLIEHGYFSTEEIIVERQQSNNTKIQSLLTKASKSSKGDGKGFPDFIIRTPKYPNLIIVSECKALIKFHESPNKDKYADFAVDGSLLYAAYLSKEYDVLAIAVSGQTKEELRISNYLHLRGQDKSHPFFGTNLLSFDDYHNGYLKSDLKFNQDYDALLAYSKQLNDSLQNKKIPESQRSLLISAILIALGNKAFLLSFKAIKTAKEITTAITGTVKSQLSESDIQNDKINNILHAYSFLQIHPTLTEDKEFVLNLIDGIDKNINGFIKTHEYFDAIGQFYIEFLRYANADKGLGIVLTPPHITQIFVELTEIDKDSVVLDNCCGTGGFLISAMRKMILDAKGNSAKEEAIKKNQLVGIEFQDHIYALAASNMILHGDGKSNIFQGDCFKLVNIVKQKFKPTVALLNPPYKNHKDDPEELSFALNALNMLVKGGKCAIILPMSCALAQTGDVAEIKRKLLEHHTLEAVLSLPSDLFHNSKVNVDTCIIVFTAHKAHSEDKKTWLGYWKDDGFIKVKNRGRVDLNGKWEGIRSEWLSAYHNRDDVPGHSVKKSVKYNDEWCAEAYMETDYSSLTKDGWIKTIRKLVAYQFMNEFIDTVNEAPVINKSLELTSRNWKEFKASEILKISRGLTSTDLSITEEREQPEDIAYLRPSNNYSIQNGYLSRADISDDKIFPPMTLAMGNTGQGSHTYTYLITEEFVPNNNLSVLVPITDLNSYHKIFLINIIEHNRYRYAYGRIPSNDRFLNSKLGLPVDSKGNPDYAFMEEFIKSLPFSSSI